MCLLKGFSFAVVENKNIYNLMTFKIALLTFVFFITLLNLNATEIKGIVKDKSNQDPMIGVAIQILDVKKGVYSGLDGSYKIKGLKPGKHKIKVSYIGYNEISKDINLGTEGLVLDFELEEKELVGRDVMVYASRNVATEESARQAEKANVGTSTIMSSKVIDVSPDITVSTVIQKMAGVSIEEEGSNEGAYAIIRGMDKRYNNTLINGIKIPSPDGRNRFVPLDIFPSDLVDRIEVYKAVTPDMEADAIGGTINLVMKNAPNEFLLKANAAVGYNDLFLERDFLSFNTNVQRSRSPGRISEWSDNLGKEEKQAVINKYFPLEASVFQRETARPNAIIGLSVGDRFGESKELGVVFALSYQSIARGQNQISTNIDPEREGGLTILDNIYVRENSVNEERLGLHNKIDYTFDKDNSLSLYNAFLMLNQAEAWYLIDSSYFRLPFVRTVDYEMFSQQVNQNIYNSTLRGDHNLGNNFVLDWSAAYSIATRNQPDRATLRLNRKEPGVDINEFGETRVDYDYQYVREFTYNFDQDMALYTNLLHISHFSDFKFENKIGGLFRYKDRETEYDGYTFRPYLNNSRNEYPGNQEYVYQGDVINGDIRNTYFRLFNPNGSEGSPNNFEVSEIVGAGYIQSKMITDYLEITAGFRAEYTQIAFQTGAYKGPQSPKITKDENDYLNILPGLFVKYKPNKKTNIRASYNQALARPSFYEFIPAIEINSDGEQFIGNPNLLNTISNNYDLRYEYFPSGLDKFFVGVFYKQLNDPIERAYSGGGQFTFENYESATNFGAELEFTKYFNQFGIRLNYSYTNSSLTAQKRYFFRLTEDNLDLVDLDVSGRLRQDLENGTVQVGDLTNILRLQERPLQGQTDHLFNISFLYKNQDWGFDAQIDMNYQGERIVFVAPEYELDWWQRPQVNLDFSAEQKFGDFTAYIKARNLLDTPREFYVKRPLVDLGVQMPEQDNPDVETFARRNFFGRNLQIGIKYFFN